MDDIHKNNKAPFVSVVMPLYNKEVEVKRAIDSILHQSIPNFELLVVNDGSTDKGPEIVRSIDDSRIRIIDQENAGVSAARNNGIHEAGAALIAFLDADDEWKPTFLETILHLKEKFPECGVFATNYLYRDINGKYRVPIIKGLPSDLWEGILNDYFGVAVKSDPPLWTSAVAVDKKAIQSIGLFPVGVASGEDILTWAKLAVRYDIAYSSKPEAVFWLRAPRSGIPTRTPDQNDIVGESLRSMLPSVSSKNKKKFEGYIRLWHKMRYSMYLRLGNHRLAIIEAKKMKNFNKNILLFYIYICIAFIPRKFVFIILKVLNYFKRATGYSK